MRFCMPPEVAMTQGVTVLTHSDSRTEQFRPYMIDDSVAITSSLKVTLSPVTPLKTPQR